MAGGEHTNDLLEKRASKKRYVQQRAWVLGWLASADITSEKNGKRKRHEKYKAWVLAGRWGGRQTRPLSQYAGTQRYAK